MLNGIQENSSSDWQKTKLKRLNVASFLLSTLNKATWTKDKMKQSELKTLIQSAASHQREMAESLKDSDNPQVVEIRKAAQARYEAFSAVLDVMCGRGKWLLTTYGKGTIL